jgi:hypothetical protein
MWGVAAMEPAEMPGQLKTDQQDTNPESDDVSGRSQVEAAYPHYQKVSDDRVEEAPQHLPWTRKAPGREALRKGSGTVAPSFR